MPKKTLKTGIPTVQKRKKASQDEMQKRVDVVIQYIRQGYPEAKILLVLKEEYGLHEKTARRAIQTAWNLIGGLGTQASSQQLGLVLTRLNHIYSEVSMGNGKNLDLAIKLLELQSKLIPLRKRGNNHELNVSPAESALSPQLSSLIEKLRTDDSIQKSSHGSRYP